MTPALRLRSDEHLVKLFRAGREDAFEALHERHRKRLQATATRALRTSGGDPEGVVQETFLRAHRALRADHPPVDLKPWLHRVARNLCIDELRKSRTTVEYQDDGATEDVFSTLSRRHELRGLIEDLADLPEQQRAALLMRELDGLSHDEVAEVLEVSPAASRQLVKRARTGLNAAAAARDADCTSIRDDLLTAHDEKRRPSEHAMRHVRGCSACREFRANLKATRSRLRALVPPLGAGPLAGLLSTVTGGTSAKLVAGACCAVLAAGGATAVLWQPGEHHVVRGTSVGTEAGGKTLIGKPIRAGTKLPPNVAIASVTVRAPAGQRTFKPQSARVTCPPGMREHGLAIPRTQDGKSAERMLRMYQTSRADYKYWRRTGRTHRTTQVDYAVRNLPAPVVISVGTLCERR